MNYIEELHKKRLEQFGEHTTIGEDRYLREFIDKEVAPMVAEVDRRAREERDEQWRTHLNVILGTELYKLHEKHFTNLTPNQ